MIEPYGGRLVDRTVPPARRPALLHEAEGLPEITLSEAVLSDLFLLAVGGLSPLSGFMDREDYEAVLGDMRLPGEFTRSEVAAVLRKAYAVQATVTGPRG
jgi:sulfate adenylyltransferase